MIEININTKINNTESQNKIIVAIENIINIKIQNFYITDLNKFYCFSLIKKNEIIINGTINLLKKIYLKIRDEKIIESFRNILLSNIKEVNSFYYTSISLNKQVAYVGKVNIITEIIPLSPIIIEIKCKNKIEIENFINWFTPKTKNGNIINEQICNF